MNVKEISQYIAKEFDTRCEVMIATYILDKGMDFCKQITDDDIAKLEDNDLMTKEFVQTLVRVSRTICAESSSMDIMRWIRKECWFTPFPKMVVIHKDDVSEDFYYDLCNELRLDDEEDSVTVYVFEGEENG